MTRITNFGRKRTYLEAGFGGNDLSERSGGQDEVPDEIHPRPESEAGILHSEKPRKRRHKKANVAGHDDGDMDVGGSRTAVKSENQSALKKAKTGDKRIRAKDQHTKAAASERRRLKRISARHASTTCLACRQKGHIVKDCPVAQTALQEDDTGNTRTPASISVGICYRCGSHRHSLSRCKKPTNEKNPLPFASCFVCSGKGHLASSCPQNQGKGIYPNGGSCKLCGQTSHLAKDCALRTQETTSRSAVMLAGTQGEGGADEDDFHMLKRRRDAVQREEAIVRRTANKTTALRSKPKVVVFK